MKSTILLIASLFLLTAINVDSDALVTKAQEKLLTASHFSYQYSSFWPNPVGKIDTVNGKAIFSKNINAYFDYNYVLSNDKHELMYVNDKFTEINHVDSTVVIHSDEDQKNRKGYIGKDNSFLMFSPLTFLKQSNWKYIKDTTIQKLQVKNYSRVEMDTTINDKYIYVENHIFIDPSSATVERFERRAYLNKAPSQTIAIVFSNYEFSQEPRSLSYALPERYRSQMYGNREKVRLLTIGEKAPEFNTNDIDGQPVNLESFRGKKVLLNFSVINCGYCKLALEEINRQGKPLSDAVVGLYINPEDGKSDVENYASKINIPFPVIAGAKGIGKVYGVSGYPTFLLIDEKGLIEKVQLGYNKKFIESLWE